MSIGSPDKELVQQALSGDQDAYTALYKRLKPRLGSIAFRYVRNADEGTTHDLITDVLMHLSKFSDEAKFTTWATRVAINCCHEMHRRENAQSRKAEGGMVYLDQEVEGSEGVYPDVADSRRPFDQWEARHDLSKILSLSTLNQRDMLIARHLMGESGLEVADRTGNSLASVKSMTHHAMMKLRRSLRTMNNEIMEPIELPNDGDEPVLAAPVVMERLTPYSLIPGIPVYGQPHGQMKRPVLKTCACSGGKCSARFYTFSGASKYAKGHNPITSTKKTSTDSLDREKIMALADRVVTEIEKTETTVTEPVSEEEQVTLTIPASALDKFIMLMPTEMKRRAVQELMANL